MQFSTSINSYLTIWTGLLSAKRCWTTGHLRDPQLLNWREAKYFWRLWKVSKMRLKKILESLFYPNLFLYVQFTFILMYLIYIYLYYKHFLLHFLFLFLSDILNAWRAYADFVQYQFSFLFIFKWYVHCAAGVSRLFCPKSQIIWELKIAQYKMYTKILAPEPRSGQPCCTV